MEIKRFKAIFRMLLLFWATVAGITDFAPVALAAMGETSVALVIMFSLCYFYSSKITILSLSK